MSARLLIIGFLLLPAALLAQPPVEPPATPPPAQAPAPPPAQAPAPPPAESPAAAPSSTDAYSYAPEGRRDPFLSLLSTSTETVAPTGRVEGIAGLRTLELSVRGVLLSEGSYMAMVQGPNNRTYVVRSGDQLADGQVKSVTAEGLVILQDVNDPLSLVKQREVYRRLRALEDAKE